MTIKVKSSVKSRQISKWGGDQFWVIRSEIKTILFQNKSSINQKIIT